MPNLPDLIKIIFFYCRLKKSSVSSPDILQFNGSTKMNNVLFRKGSIPVIVTHSIYDNLN